MGTIGLGCTHCCRASDVSKHSAVFIRSWLCAFAVLASCGPNMVKDVLRRLLEATTATELHFVKEFSDNLLAGNAIKPIGETEIVIDARGVLQKEDAVVMVALVAAGAFDNDTQLLVDGHIRALGADAGSSGSSRDHIEGVVNSNDTVGRKIATGSVQLPCSRCRATSLCHSQSVGYSPCI